MLIHRSSELVLYHLQPFDWSIWWTGRWRQSRLEIIHKAFLGDLRHSYYHSNPGKFYPYPRGPWLKRIILGLFYFPFLLSDLKFNSHPSRIFQIGSYPIDYHNTYNPIGLVRPFEDIFFKYWFGEFWNILMELKCMQNLW